MIIKKFYGNTIAEARSEAKAELGESIVVLESKDKAGKAPASVTVMIKSSPKKEEIPSKAVAKPAYSRASITRKEPVFANIMEQMESIDEEERIDNSQSDRTPGTPSLSRRGTALYTKDFQKEDVYASEQSIAHTQHSSHDLSLLTARLNTLEKTIASHFMQSSAEYISHPSYQQLLSAGIPAGTIHSWFTSILEKGVDPHQDNENFMIELGAAVQRTLPQAPSIDIKKMLVFMGASGSRKTSLITKLSKNKHFLNGNKLAIVSILGSDTNSLNPLLYDFTNKHQFEYFEVSTQDELRGIKKQLEGFDQVLFDTPSLSLKSDIASLQLNRLKPLFDELGDYELHLIANATLHASYFSEAYISSYPIRPDFISLTHLDESLSFGHLLPLIRVSNCDVRYISHGPSPYDDIRLYDQGWFAGKILALEEF